MATLEEAIRQNARTVIDVFGPLSDLGAKFGYNRDSVAWLQGFLERERHQPNIAAADVENLVQLIGSFLGECIIITYSGVWREHDNGTLGVFFNESNAAFPFSKVRKQWENGVEGGDSILGFFEIISKVFRKE
jgi:hypothetical protein